MLVLFCLSSSDSGHSVGDIDGDPVIVWCHTEGRRATPMAAWKAKATAEVEEDGDDNELMAELRVESATFEKRREELLRQKWQADEGYKGHVLSDKAKKVTNAHWQVFIRSPIFRFQAHLIDPDDSIFSIHQF